VNNLFRLIATLVFLALAPRLVATAPKRFVCSPCGQPCDDVVYDEPGVCPRCGMRLIAQEEAVRARRKTVAIVIFNGVQIIDYTGPYEVFGAAAFDVYTVAETKDPVTTAMGMTVVPKYTFADAPQADVLVVPGGAIKLAQESTATLKWIRETAAHAENTMSVCNGAFILATAGLLDGLTATTTSRLIDQLKAEYPKVKVVYDQRFVDNGRVITTGGLSSGIDGALHVVSKMLGKGRAQAVALSEEYDWRPRSGFARAALADSLIPDINLDEMGQWTIVSTEGGTDRWEIVAMGTSDRSALEVMDHVGRILVTKGNWKPSSSSPTKRSWTFTGRNGEPWTSSLTIQAVPGESQKYEARLVLARVG